MNIYYNKVTARLLFREARYRGSRCDLAVYDQRLPSSIRLGMDASIPGGTHCSHGNNLEVDNPPE